MSSAPEPASEQLVRLLDHDPDLGRRLSPDRLRAAQQHARVAAVSIRRGAWDPSSVATRAARPAGLLVLDGLLSRDVLLGDVAAAQLLGPGDLIEVPADGAPELMAIDVRWSVLEPSTVALIDDAFLFSARAWPELVADLFERVVGQSARHAKHRAICQLPRVEDRVHALLWFLAERWGRVTAHGVIVPLRLTHGTLGQLVGAKRPTVSLAIKRLARDDRVHRRGDGAWLLSQAWTPHGGAAAAPRWPRGGFAASVQPDDAEPATAVGPPAVVVRLGRGLDQRTREPAPTPQHEIRARIERMRDAHERALVQARETRARSLAARERSAELRARVTRAWEAQSVPVPAPPEDDESG